MKKNCELCKQAAKMHCESDQANLCWNCDWKVHSANFIVARHSRTLLCHLCHSPTPWTCAGSNFGPIISVCGYCVGSSKSNSNHHHSTDIDLDDEESRAETDLCLDDDEEEEVVGNCDFQARSTPPPVNSDDEEEDRESCCSSSSLSGISHQPHVRSDRKRKRKIDSSYFHRRSNRHRRLSV